MKRLISTFVYVFTAIEPNLCTRHLHVDIEDMKVSKDCISHERLTSQASVSPLFQTTIFVQMYCNKSCCVM